VQNYHCDLVSVILRDVSQDVSVEEGSILTERRQTVVLFRRHDDRSKSKGHPTNHHPFFFFRLLLFGDPDPMRKARGDTVHVKRGTNSTGDEYFSPHNRPAGGAHKPLAE